jgi:hypothetical protein
LQKRIHLKIPIKGSGNEFERIDEIKQTNSKIYNSINFPEAYDVSNTLFGQSN